MNRKELEQQIAEFLANTPSQDERLRLAATLLHQANNLLASFGEETRRGAEDAMQDVLDTAEQMDIDVWED